MFGDGFMIPNFREPCRLESFLFVREKSLPRNKNKDELAMQSQKHDYHSRKFAEIFRHMRNLLRTNISVCVVGLYYRFLLWRTTFFPCIFVEEETSSPYSWTAKIFPPNNFIANISIKTCPSVICLGWHWLQLNHK